MKKNVIVLGSTGVLGKIALELLKENSKDFNIVGLSGYKNENLLSAQKKKFKPKYGVCISKNDAVKMVIKKGVDIVLVACRGVDFKDVVVSAIRKGKKIAMANKEMIVEYGDEIMKEVKKNNCIFVPVDSEHSGVFQCIHGKKHEDIEKIYLTCSGGPFRGYSKEKLKTVTAEQALKHPVWNMGEKTTIDSATLMNKALEIIEAKYLFGLRPEQIDVLIHPQSIVHALVQFKDGNIHAHMGYPDMRIPLYYALYYPEIKKSGLPRLNLINQKLEFFKPDTDKFPSINYAYRALKKGPSFVKKLNRANEEAVKKFLDKKINFTEIFLIIKKTFS